MTRRGRLEVAAWLVVAAVGLAIDLLIFGPGEVAQWLPDVAVGWAFLGGAMLVDRRGQDRRLALLLGLTGLTWFAGGLDHSLAFLHRGPLVHLLFAYPTGRLVGVARFVVPMAYVVAVVPGAWSSELTTVGLAAALAAAVVVHRRSARGPIRRARIQAAVVGGLVLGVVGASALARLVFTEGDADRLTLLAYEASLVAVALATARAVIRGTWRRAGVADLVVRLGGERSGAVRDALARELGDPSLQVGYRVGDGYVDASGRPFDVPAGGGGRASTTVEHLGKPVAVLVHDPAVLADDALLDAVAVAALLVERNTGLRADVEEQLADLEDARRRLVAAADAERGRLAQRLADGAGQRLSELADALTAAGAVANGPSAVGDSERQIERVQLDLDRTRRDLEVLASGLHPAGLDTGDLGAALRVLAAGCPIPVHVVAAPGPHLNAEVAAAAWFVSAEAVANAVKHSGAGSIGVEVTASDGLLRLTIADDGSGGADQRRGSGLRGLADRVDTLGGSLQVTSPPGQGTVVLALLPRRLLR